MTELRVVEGRQSPLYNHFEEYELVSCRATDTRLMGVVALKLSWQDPICANKRYYQIIHLDYSEYGVDEYLEFECLPEDPDYKYLRAEVQDRWNRFIRVSGGSAVSITPYCALRLIDSALALAGDDVKREYDTEENRLFRMRTLQRIALMRKTLEQRGVDVEECSVHNSISAVSVKGRGAFGTVNYFLMRLLDRDFDAASYLSSIPRDELEKSELASRGIQSLMRSDIKKVPKRYNPRADEMLRMYDCHITTLSMDGYYHVSLSIWLDGRDDSTDARTVAIEVGTSILLSDYEAAIQVAQGEYITVFEYVKDLPVSFETMYLKLFSSADKSLCENGVLYTVYNETNDHVESDAYRLGDDVFGYALITIGGELIIMSTDLDRISVMDDEIMLSMLAPHLVIKGRCKMESPIFHTLCHTQGVNFDDLVDPEY